MSQTSQDQFMTAVRYLLFFAGSWLATHKYIQVADVNGLVAAILIIVPPAWAWINNQIQAKRVAAGVQAGVSMTLQKKALAADGSTITDLNGGTTPPKPVTVATAQQIVKDFAPPVNSISKV